jgi:hypothetical protein
MKDFAGCLVALLIIVVNLVWISLVVWGVFELIMLIKRS